MELKWILSVLLLVLVQAAFGDEQLSSSSTVSTDPPGHLLPVGFHRPAEIVIDEYTDPYEVSPQQFYDKYVSQQKPVVFRGASKHFPAFRQWTEDKLSEKYGHMEMRIETRKDGSSNDLPYGALGIGRDTLANFLVHKDESDNYVVSELPTPMYPDVEILPCMSCGNMRSKISEINLWMSGGGSRSRLHRDAFNAINCQLNGTKDWIMVPNNQTDNVYFVASSEYEMGGLSPVNTDAVDLKKYPRFRNVPWGITTIEAGDCIYVPGGHYHQVRSYGFSNTAVSVLFSRIELVVGFDSTGCDKTKPEFISLDKIDDILWQYPGTGMMSMGNMDDMLFRLSVSGPKANATTVTKKRFTELKMSSMEPTSESRAIVNQMYSLIDPEGKGTVSPKDFDLLPRENWRQLQKLTEPDLIYSNSYLYEFAQLDYDAVLGVMARAFKKYNVMDEDDFVDVYHNGARGSEYYGRKFFSELDVDKDGYVSWTEAKKNSLLKKVLRPFAEHTEEDDGGNHFADGDEERSMYYGDEAKDRWRLEGQPIPGEGQEEPDVEEDFEEGEDSTPVEGEEDEEIDEEGEDDGEELEDRRKEPEVGREELEDKHDEL